MSIRSRGVDALSGSAAAILYNGSIAIHVGYRHLVEMIYVYSGVALPVPMVLGLIH